MDNKLISSRQYGFIKGRSTSDLPTLVNCHAVIPGPFPVSVSLSILLPLSLPYAFPSPPALSVTFISFPYPFPSLSSPCPIPQIQLGGLGKRCQKLPQRVRAEPGCPGRARPPNAFWCSGGKNWALACGAGLTALQNE